MSAREPAIEVMRPLLAGSDRDMIEAALDALLAARSEEPCPTCRNTGKVAVERYDTWDICPDPPEGCGGTGTRPLLAALMEES